MTEVKNDDGSISDPELYTKLLEPHPSLEVANNNLGKFYEEFRELRKKYSIPDVVLILRSIYMNQGEKCDALTTMNCGNSSLVYPMVHVIWERQREKFLYDLGVINIPLDIWESPEFFTDLMMYAGIIRTQDEAEVLIKNGEIQVDGNAILVDGPAPDGEFVLTFRGESIKFPGKTKK